MAYIEAFSFTDPQGRTWGFDNSPGSGFANNGPFANVNWASGQVSVTGASIPTVEFGLRSPGELYKVTVQQNGLTYIAELFSNEHPSKYGFGYGFTINEVQMERITYQINGTKTFEILFQDFTYTSPDGSTLNLTTFLSERIYNLYSGDLLIYTVFNGNDFFGGTNASDHIVGYGGDDILLGRGGDDILNGGIGNDVIRGGNGDDLLIGDWGANNYYGGEGFDTAQLKLKSTDYIVSKHPTTGAVLLIYEDGSIGGLVDSDVEQISFSNGTVISTDMLTYKGSGLNQEVPNAAVDPVFRFYNARDNAFFYTVSAAEKQLVIEKSAYSQPDSDEWPYIYQGSTFEAAHSYSSAVAPLHRFYNTETGHHFFTTSNEEMQLVKSKSESGEWPFNYEGIAFNVYSSDPNPGGSYSEVPVHRFYSPSLNRHFFTADEAEVAAIELTGIWNYEGIGFWGEVV